MSPDYIRPLEFDRPVNVSELPMPTAMQLLACRAVLSMVGTFERDLPSVELERASSDHVAATTLRPPISIEPTLSHIGIPTLISRRQHRG